MPLYEYECQKCGHRFEKIEKVSGPHATKCPKCSGKVERLLTAPAIQFKGAGWYVTDYARKGSGDSTAGDSTGGDAAKAENTEKESKKKSKEASSAKEIKKTGTGKKE